MLAAASGSSIVVVAGRVWCMGNTHTDTESYWDEAKATYNCMDRALFVSLNVVFAGACRCHTAFVTICCWIYMQGSLSFVFYNCIQTTVCHIKGDVKGVCIDRHYGSPSQCPRSSLVWPACPSGSCRQQVDLRSSWARMCASGALPCSRTSTPCFCDSCSCWCCVFNSWSAGSIAFCEPSFFWDLFCFIFCSTWASRDG